MSKLLKYLFITLVAMLSLVAQGQSIDDLRRQIEQAEKEIRVNNELLGKTRKDQKVNESQLKLISGRIRSRQSIVSSLNQQISLINTNIDGKNSSIKELNNEVGRLKSEYAKMARDTYINHKLNNFLLFIFASEDFNDVTKRINFMRRYNQQRVEKASQIKAMTDSISSEVTALDSQRADLDNTKKSRSGELLSLGKDESQFKKSAGELKSQEGRLTRKVKEKQAQITKAQQQIARIIEEEARRNRTEKRTEAEDRYIVELSGRFDENKGKLPYPVRGGVIIDRYGSHPHPTERGVIINNKGVNIAGAAGADVYAVFEGKVTKIVSIPGLNNCVMVRHGNYITLYANLSSVSVKNGDQISHNQLVGQLSQSANSDDHFLHFELWRETTNLNPEEWLRR